MRLRRQIAEALQYNSLPMLLRYADRSAMAFSRETRFPFLDHELVELDGARHEILMERPAIRARVWQAVDRFLAPPRASATAARS